MSNDTLRPVGSATSAGPSATTAIGTAGAMSARVLPVPSDEEAVAIMAAVEALWPRAAVAPPLVTPRNTAWRFSARSWSRPVPVRRLRPWR